MRICLISREYPPETGFGGIATFANHLAIGLTELGHQVEVVALAKDKASTVEQEGVTVHRVEPRVIVGDLAAVSISMPYSRYVLKTTSALWAKFHELHQERPFDVVDTPELLAEGIYPAVTRVAPLLIRLYTPHSKFIAERLHNVVPSFDHQFVATLERIAMLSADVITSPSADLSAFVSQDLNYPVEGIRIVRNPIDPVRFSPDGDRALTPDGRLTVLFVGRLEARKGIDYLVAAIPKVVSVVPGVRFVIIGDDTNNASGQRSVLAGLQDSLRKSRSTSYVEFIDRVPLDRLPDYYRSADICIVPSLYDNSPYTCLEAMSCGRAVVGTSGGGTREYIVHGESGLIIPPRDADSIANALIGLLKSESERQRLAANARRRVLDHFQRTEIARQTVSLYEETIDRFQARLPGGLYLKPAEQALPDADAFLFSFDQMLYDLLYLKSYRFRINHWWRLITTRPRLSLLKAVLSCARRFVRLLGIPQEETPSVVARLEEAVKVRQFGIPAADLAMVGQAEASIKK